MDIQLKTMPLPNGEALGYRERSGGTVPLLLIHGNMISSKHWDVVMENLPERYKVYAVDLRGNGISTYESPIHAHKDFAEDVNMFVDLIGMESFHLVGWSSGGGVSMELAANYPEKVRKQILLGSISTRGYPFYRFDNAGNLTNDRLKTKAEISQDMRRSVPLLRAYATRDKAFLKHLLGLTMYTKHQPSPSRYEEYLDDILTQRNLIDVYYANNVFNISDVHNGLVEGTGEVNNIQAETLVLRGTEDLAITKDMALEIVGDIGPNAMFHELTGCGHSPLVDDLGQLLHVMTDFLER